MNTPKNTIKWRDYAVYIGGKARYWRIKFNDDTWQDIHLKADKMKPFILPLILNGILQKLTNTRTV